MSSWGPDAGAPGDDRVAIDPYPSTGSLRWAPDDDATQAMTPPRGTSVGGDDPTEVLRPDEVVPPPPIPPGGGRGPRRGTPRDRRRDEMIIVASVALLVVLVAVVALTTLGGGSTDDDTPPTTAAPVPGDGSAPAGPVVGPTGVVGSWSGTEWISGADTDVPDTDLTFSVVGLGDEVRTVESAVGAEGCAASDAAGPDLGDGGEGPPAVAVAGVADARPRPVERFDTASPTYRQAAVDVAAGLGVTSAPEVTQVLRTDLDGSGTDEVLVAAEHVAGPGEGRRGRRRGASDWSVVFLREVAGNGVATHVLASSVAGDGGDGGGAVERIQVSSLADLNGDGTMEVVLDGRAEDGRWTAVHAFAADGTPDEVLRSTCGD